MAQSQAAQSSRADRLIHLGPGIALASAVAIAATLAAPLVERLAPIPVMVIALAIGILLNPVAERPLFLPGLTFCAKVLLRWAVALLGLRIAFGDIVDLGLGNALLVVGAMAVTVVGGFAIARLFGREDGLGALAGAGTAVCGASATLATSTVVPDYPGKKADIAFVVVAVNALSTVAMVVYPPLCVALGLSDQATGVLLGATIHDVAQVVGAGYSVNESVGNTAVVVKLFRVFLLLPVVLGIGWYFTRIGAAHGQARVPVPVFALVFLALAFVNSIVPAVPGLAELYAPVKSVLGGASAWGMLIAISALGLGTSLAAIARLGWRHVALISATTLLILAVVTVGVLAIG